MSSVTQLEKAAEKIAREGRRQNSDRNTGRGEASSIPTDALPKDADHLKIAERYIAQEAVSSGVRPVFALGALHTYSRAAGLWSPVSLDALAAAVGRMFSDYKLCRRNSDYKQIAALIATCAEDDDFFADAPGGVAAAGSFYRVTSSGEIAVETLTAEHRQRMSVVSAPDFEAAPPLLDALLDNAFGIGDAGDAQRELLQQGLGAALTGMLWRYRTVLMLYGASSTGKSTILEVLKCFFSPDRVGATNPQNWGHEYHAAALAGRALNLVGELDPTSPIPGGIFKAVTGGDVIEARHPNHRPFSFVCMAGHVFNCNRLPPTRDKSDAFFRRWRVVEFQNSIAPGQEIIGLAERIFAEEQAAVLGWLLKGAASLARRGSLPDTDNHRRLIEYWRAANNSALQFILDREYVEASKAGMKIPAQEVFAAYRKWANDVGLKPMGRNAFYEAIGDGGGRHGVTIADDRDGVKIVHGVSLRKCL